MVDEKISRMGDFLRVHEIPERFPVFGRSVWNSIVARGDVASRKIGRARIVRVADVVAFLEGRVATTGGAR